MFGPRWLLAVPPGLLFLVARPVRRRPAVVALAAVVVVLGPVMGLLVPWGRLEATPAGGPRLRVLTCNMHYGREPRELMALVADTQPHVVALQEWREPHGSAAPTWDGWHVRRSPGLFLASRYPVRAVEYLGRNSASDQGLAARYDLDTPAGPVTLFSLHLASPREELKEAVGRRSGWTPSGRTPPLRDRQSAYMLRGRGQGVRAGRAGRGLQHPRRRASSSAGTGAGTRTPSARPGGAGGTRSPTAGRGCGSTTSWSAGAAGRPTAGSGRTSAPRTARSWPTWRGPPAP